MGSIKFSGLDISPGALAVAAEWEDSNAGSGVLEFRFDAPVVASPDLTAIALSTLCGRTYSSVSFDFPVSVGTQHQVSGFTGADVTARPGRGDSARLRSGHVLSFSGGFDSLAALALMPDSTVLAATDFRGRFGREREFFSRFKPLTMSTNLVDFPLRKNSWSFMGIAPILASDYIGSRYLTFGSVLLAGGDNLSRQPATASGGTFPPFAAAGYRNAPYVSGLPDGAILQILLQYEPELLGDSLVSLAGPREEKAYRKYVQLQLASDRAGIPVAIPEVPRPAEPHFRWGQALIVDVLCIYVIALTGERDALGLARDVPADVIEAALMLTPGFMEKANPTVYRGFPDELYGGLAMRLGEYGIRWYDEADWVALERVRQLLAPNHPVVAK